MSLQNQNAFATQTEDSASESIFRLIKEWGHCDLIVDRALGDPLREQLTELPPQQKALPINPKKATVSDEECLLMVRLSMDQLPLLDSSVEISLEQNVDPTHKVRSIGGWLFSRDITPERMASRLEKAIIVRIPNSSNALLRVWDPRVISHLQRILTPEQLATLLGPIECWAWVDRSGCLQLLKKPTTSVQTRMPAQLPIKLTAEQDAAVDRIEHINTLLRTLAQLGHSIVPERDQELDDLLLKAQRLGHHNPTDMIAYGLHAILISKTFDMIPEVQQAIAQAQAKGLGLCAALEQFDDDYWNARKGKT